MDDSRIAEEVLAYLLAEGVELTEDLTQVEKVVRDQMPRIGARVIVLHLAGRRLGYRGASVPYRCVSCGGNCWPKMPGPERRPNGRRWRA